MKKLSHSKALLLLLLCITYLFIACFRGHSNSIMAIILVAFALNTNNGVFLQSSNILLTIWVLCQNTLRFINWGVFLSYNIVACVTYDCSTWSTSPLVVVVVDLYSASCRASNALLVYYAFYAIQKVHFIRMLISL